MSLQQAAQRAVEAWFQPHGINYVDFKPYMEALRAAFAEPEQIGYARCPRCWEPITAHTPRKPQSEQEPVACIGTNGELMWLNKPKGVYSKPIPLYTAPTPRKPLTEPELHAITPTWPAPGQEWGYEEVLAFVRAIERAHGITREQT